MSSGSLHSGPRRYYLRARRRDRSQTAETQILAQEKLADPKSTTSKLHEGKSWVKSKILPKLSSWFQARRRYNPAESFFPFARISFLIDKPATLVCQICRESRCRVQSENVSPENDDDSIFAILPCGHVAGSRCLRTWLRDHENCPFCRISLRHADCGHRIDLHPLTTESLYFLPRTLADGGRIAENCADCMRRKMLARSRVMLADISKEFEDTMQQYLQSQRDVDMDKMNSTRERFEPVLLDEVYWPSLQALLHEW